MDIIIFSGQSNMQGQSERLSDSSPVSGAYEYKWLDDEIVPLKNPVGEDIKYDKTRGVPILDTTNLREWLSHHAMGSACYGHTNLVPAFCKTYQEITGHKVLAVHAAKGSTCITNWLPGEKTYEILCEKALAAQKKVSVDRVFFVWLQGESDAIIGCSKDNYKNSLAILCDALMRDIGIETFGIIRVGRFTGDERDTEIIAAQDEICAENEKFLMLSDIAVQLNEMPEYMHPQIRGHYSALGLEKLGTEAAKTLAEFVMKK